MNFKFRCPQIKLLYLLTCCLGRLLCSQAEQLRQEGLALEPEILNIWPFTEKARRPHRPLISKAGEGGLHPPRAPGAPPFPKPSWGRPGAQGGASPPSWLGPLGADVGPAPRFGSLDHPVDVPFLTDDSRSLSYEEIELLSATFQPPKARATGSLSGALALAPSFSAVALGNPSHRAGKGAWRVGGRVLPEMMSAR